MKEIFKNLLMEFAGTGEAEQDGFFEKETDCTATASVAVVSEEAFDEASLEKQEITEEQILHEIISEPVVRRNGRTFRPARRIGIFSKRLVALAAIAVLFVTVGPMKMVAKANTLVIANEINITADNQITDIIGDHPFTAEDSLKLNGNTTINLNGHSLIIKRIYCEGAPKNLEIIGPGSLTVNGAGAGAGCTDSTVVVADLEIDNAIVSATDRIDVSVVWCSGKLELKNGATLSANNSGDGSAIWADQGIFNAEIVAPAGGAWRQDGVNLGVTLNGVDAKQVTLRAISSKVVKKTDSPPAHVHKYEWVTIREATEDEDGEMDYMCTEPGCGHVLYQIPLTGCYIFNVNAMNRILNAPGGATVTVSTTKWISFHKMVRDALQKRPDVTLVVNFLSEGYRGEAMQFTIPAGTDPAPLFDENGYAGFLRIKGLLEAKK